MTTSHTSGSYVLDTEAASGLTKREFFAALALQGLLTNPAQLATDVENQTGLAVEYADALIATLSDEERA